MAWLKILGIMSSMIWRLGSRRALAIWLATAMLNLGPTVALSSPMPDSDILTGITTVAGVATIDGLPALSGQTLFSGSSIETAQGSESRLDLGNLARLKLYAATKLTVEFSRSTLSGSLGQGILHSFVPIGVRADLVAADASISTDPDQPTAFTIQLESRGATISVETGRVEVRTGNSSRSVTAGNSFSTLKVAALSPEPPQNSSNRKRLWLLLGIGGAVAVLLVAITGRDHEDEIRCDVVSVPSPSGLPEICP